MTPYNPNNWYWLVAGNQAQVFSSSAGNFVPADDAAYLAWCNDGNVPSRIASEAELGEVLAAARVRPADSAVAVMDAFKFEHAKEMTEEVQTKALLWVINEIRILKGQTALTKGTDIRAFFKELM